MSARHISVLALALGLAAASAARADVPHPEISSLSLHMIVGDLDSRFELTRSAGGALLAFRRSDGLVKSVALAERDWNDVVEMVTGRDLTAGEETCPRRSIELRVGSRVVSACLGAHGAGARLARLADALGAAVMIRPAAR